MIVSKIEDNDVVYYCLHAEQAVTGALLGEPENGIFEEILTKNTLERVIVDFGVQKDKNLVLDFSRIKSSQNNLHHLIIQSLANWKSLTFLNVHKVIVEKLRVHGFSNQNNSEEGDYYKKFLVSMEGNVTIRDIVEVFNAEFTKYITKHTKESQDDLKVEPYFSSSVYLTKYIDVKSMISDNKGLLIYALYHLALKVYSHWDEVRGDEKPTLICQNLNGSYIASILSSFLKLDILILDKLGPINKLYSTLDNKIEDNKTYLVVSDLVCLGTEIKIAKSLITFLGGKYIGNLSLIRIETLLKNTKSFDDTECVFTISKENNPINYQIKTALDL